MSVTHSARSGGIKGIFFLFSLLGDSNEYTQYTIFNIKKNITLNYPKSIAMGFSQETQERVQNSRGKRVIRVRGIKSSTVIVQK